MHYLRPVIDQINAQMVAALPASTLPAQPLTLAHNLVNPVVIREELWHYTLDMKPAQLWDNDYQTVFYHKAFSETYADTGQPWGRRVLYKADSVITLFICSELPQTHGLLLDVLSKISFVTIIASDFNKPQIIQSETLRLEKMDIEQFVSSITYQINKNLTEILKLC